MFRDQEAWEIITFQANTYYYDYYYYYYYITIGPVPLRIHCNKWKRNAQKHAYLLHTGVVHNIVAIYFNNTF